jgi:hypothetical protein
MICGIVVTRMSGGRFLVPFTKGQTKGSVILVTTRFPELAPCMKLNLPEL